MEEIEVKFLNIDKEALEQKLVSFEAVKAGDYDYRRKIFDYPDNRLDKDGAWIRLRDEGEQVTLSYKQRFGVADSSELVGGGMNELEVVVSNFEETEKILAAIGLVECVYIENKRTRYTLDGVEIDIDTWPLLNPHAEIEGKSWEAVQAMAEKLGFNWEDRVSGSSRAVYKKMGFDEDSYKVLTFKEQIKR